MKLVLEGGAVRHERIHKKALGTAFGATESQELDEVFVLDLHQRFERTLKVVLSERVPRVVDRLHSNRRAISQGASVHSRMAVLPQEILLGEVVRGRFELVQVDPGAPLGRAGESISRRDR